MFTSPTKSVVLGGILLLVGDGISIAGKAAEKAKEAPSSAPAPFNPNQFAPKGYTISEESVSPDHHYGVTVPLGFEDDDVKARNSLIDLRTGRVLAVLQTKFPGWSHEGHGGVLPARWSEDGSLLLWEVAGKWTPHALTLVQIHEGHVVWQIDLLKAAEREILKATRAAKPKAYAAAKKSNQGNGAAYPEGFTVDVKTEEKPLALPMWISVILTANPKEIADMPKLDSYLLGAVDENGRFVVKDFQFSPPKSPHFVDSETFPYHKP